MTKCYLTIDDSPTPYTDSMCDFLSDRGITALLFVRGDMVEKYGSESLVRAVRNGFHLANHAYSHTYAHLLSYDQIINEIETVDVILNEIYHKAGVKRPGKYFRFPHMDRGAGGYIVDYDAYSKDNKHFVTRLFADGVRVDLVPPTQQQIDKKNQVQDYLKKENYSQPFKHIAYPWFKGSEMELASDCMYTFSTSDWMLLDRHRGKHKFKTLQDLKDKIDDDPYLGENYSNAIILIHDKPEPEFPLIFETLIDHMVIKGYEFLSVS